MPNSDDVLIKVENVSKKFCRSLKRSMLYGIEDISRDLLHLPDTSEHLRKDEFWAVDDVSFEVKRGECLGIIGRNGAGKSTLLKMLNGIFMPDKGKITIKGKVGALIEVGAGFHPMLTGRENVYVNGAILGMSKREIDKKFDEIITFAELEEFIDMPVKHYSSGMYVRLGFAIAVQMEPDVLLIDEVLAVGDISFVLKCFNRIDRLLENTALIFISHNMSQVSRICNQILFIKQGKEIFLGNDVMQGVNAYYASLKNETGNFIGSCQAKLCSIKLASGKQQSTVNEVLAICYGAELKIILEINVDNSIKNPHLYFAFHDKEQRNFAEIYSSNSHFRIENHSGKITLEIVIPSINFSQGIYSITVTLSESKNGQVLFRHQSAIYFQVIDGVHGWAPIQIRPQWQQKNLPHFQKPSNRNNQHKIAL
ncbi:ABC transporter ATP-binding protein [Methylotuvimicrobium sp. KM2]|uniref:ABC transporter ATP-binding protein n=1 Tax=Methylotuvimicrobium sp. KM2 TaxID=3133976 RepID=UPI0031010291